ncbi:MAG: hypothetical protein H7Z16_08620 [Pyrinomonadaceae bacterium]|nr:hypothetical protein [Pyrinomonadaceae bacterium]
MSWFRNRPLLTATGVVLIPAAIAITLARFVDDDLRKGLYTGAITLVFGGLLGGLLKILLDDVTAARRKRDDAATFVRNVLNDLKTVYDRVGLARIVIPAHRSTKTYGEEMRDLIKGRVQLKHVIRALEGRAEGLTKVTAQNMRKEVNRMATYLKVLTDEFKNNYKRLSDSQREYEMRVETELKRSAERREASPPDIFSTVVWDQLQRLEVLSDFINGHYKSAYQTNFVAPLDEASRLLRAELARILSGKPPESGEKKDLRFRQRVIDRRQQAPSKLSPP